MPRCDNEMKLEHLRVQIMSELLSAMIHGPEENSIQIKIMKITIKYLMTILLHLLSTCWAMGDVDITEIFPDSRKQLYSTRIIKHLKHILTDTQPSTLTPVRLLTAHTHCDRMSNSQEISSFRNTQIITRWQPRHRQLD